MLTSITSSCKKSQVMWMKVCLSLKVFLTSKILLVTKATEVVNAVRPQVRQFSPFPDSLTVQAGTRTAPSNPRLGEG